MVVEAKKLTRDLLEHRGDLLNFKLIVKIIDAETKKKCYVMYSIPSLVGKVCTYFRKCKKISHKEIPTVHVRYYTPPRKLYFTITKRKIREVLTLKPLHFYKHALLRCKTNTYTEYTSNLNII